MRTIIQFFTEIVLGVTGSLALAAAIVGAAVVLGGCGLWACNRAWHGWKQKRETRAGIQSDQ